MRCASLLLLFPFGLEVRLASAVMHHSTVAAGDHICGPRVLQGAAEYGHIPEEELVQPRRPHYRDKAARGHGAVLIGTSPAVVSDTVTLTASVTLTGVSVTVTTSARLQADLSAG